MTDPSAGEIGGTFAVVNALLVAVGHVFDGCLIIRNSHDRTCSEKLQAWQNELTQASGASDGAAACQVRGDLDQHRPRRADLLAAREMWSVGRVLRSR